MNEGSQLNKKSKGSQMNEKSQLNKGVRVSDERGVQLKKESGVSDERGVPAEQGVRGLK